MAHIQAPLSMVYRSDKQLPVLFRTLHGFYRMGTFCDVVLVASHCRIQVHSVIVAAFSPLLYQMLGGENWSIDRRQTEVTLPNVDRIALLSLIDYCYTGVITVDSSSAEKILGVAIALQVKEVEKLCVTFLNALQSFSSELTMDTKPSGLVSTSSGRGGNYREQTSVESSERYSPNVSTSGQPSSETGSTGHPESDIIAVKTETPDPPSYDYDPNNLYRHSRTQVVYLDGTDDNLDSHRLVIPQSTHGVIDMSKMSPTFLPSPILSMPSLMLPTGPPALQLMSPKRDTAVMERTPSHREKYPTRPGNEITSPESDRHSTHGHSPDRSSQRSGEQLREVDNDEPLLAMTCSICHVLVHNEEALNIHMAQHHSAINSESRQQETMVKSPAEDVKRQAQKFYQQRQSTSRSSSPEQDSSGLFRCGTCGKGLKNAQSLKFHRYNHVLRHCCNMCGKRFSRSWNLHRHRKTHFRMPSWPMRTDVRASENVASSADEQSVDLTTADDEDMEGNEKDDLEEPHQVSELLSGDFS